MEQGTSDKGELLLISYLYFWNDLRKFVYTLRLVSNKDIDDILSITTAICENSKKK